jgi:hypothetical protein
MKKVYLLFVSILIFGVLFTSCTKDDSGPVDMNLIEGKWNFNKSTATSSGITIPYPTDYFKNEDGCNKDYIDIKTGGIVKYADSSLNCVLIEKDGTWTQSANTITINVTGTSLIGTFNVTSLSATELILKFDGTTPGGISGTFNLYFTK